MELLEDELVFLIGSDVLTTGVVVLLSTLIVLELLELLVLAYALGATTVVLTGLVSFWLAVVLAGVGPDVVKLVEFAGTGEAVSFCVLFVVLSTGLAGSYTFLT